MKIVNPQFTYTNSIEKLDAVQEETRELNALNEENKTYAREEVIEEDPSEEKQLQN